MKGHIRERSPGRWAIIIDIRDSGNREAQAQLAFVQGHQARGPERVCPADHRACRPAPSIRPREDRWRPSSTAGSSTWVVTGLAAHRTSVMPRSRRKNLVPLLGGTPLTQASARPYQHGLRQGAHQRPPERAGAGSRRAPSPHAPGAAAGAPAGRAMAAARPQPGRRREAAQGRAQADVRARRRRHGRADRGGAVLHACSCRSCSVCSADYAGARSPPCGGAPSISTPGSSR